MDNIAPSRKFSKSLSSHLQGFSGEENFACWPEAASDVHFWSLALSIRDRVAESEDDGGILVPD